MLKKVEISTLTLLFIFVFYCALTIGISWDLEMEIERGNERLKYILFRGVSLTDVTKMTEERPINYECILSNILMGRGGIWIFFCRFEAMLLLSSLGMLGRTAWELGVKPS